jgi:hypothetical protein
MVFPTVGGGAPGVDWMSPLPVGYIFAGFRSVIPIREETIDLAVLRRRSRRGEVGLNVSDRYGKRDAIRCILNLGAKRCKKGFQAPRIANPTHQIAFTTASATVDSQSYDAVTSS